MSRADRARARSAIAATAAQDTDWPNKPVKFIVPFPPAGSVDPLARLVGVRLSAALGQQFIVNNRPGGSGSIGAAAAAKASPDGYTFLFVFDTHAVNLDPEPALRYGEGLGAGNTGRHRADGDRHPSGQALQEFR